MDGLGLMPNRSDFSFPKFFGMWLEMTRRAMLEVDAELMRCPDDSEYDDQEAEQLDEPAGY